MEDHYISDIINTILVIENVRPSYMIQQLGIDINIRYKDVIKILSNIFPEIDRNELILTDTNHGLVFSKQRVSKIQTDYEIGKTIGYPASLELKSLCFHKTVYTIALIANLNLKDKTVKEIQIFANACMDINPYIDQFEVIREKAEKALNKGRCISLLAKNHNLQIDNINVKLVYSTQINSKDIIERLSKNSPIFELEKETIKRDILCVSNKTSFFKYLDYNNRTHMGILAVVLLEVDFTINAYRLNYKLVKTIEEIKPSDDKFMKIMTSYIKRFNYTQFVELDLCDIPNLVYQYYNPFHIGMLAANITKEIFKQSRAILIPENDLPRILKGDIKADKIYINALILSKIE